MAKLEETRVKTGLWRRRWFPWAAVAVLVVIAGGLLWLTLSAHSRQRGLEEELALQKEMIQSLRAQAAQDEEEKLVHPSEPVITASQVSGQLSALQELVTTEYLYTNSGKYESQNQITIIGQDINIPFTGKRFIVAYDGRIQAGVDLRQAQIAVDEGARTVCVTLPASRITAHETFEDTLVVLDETNNVFNPISIENYSEFVSQQKTAMEQKAIDHGLLDDADAQARAVVGSFLALLPGMEGYQLTVN